MGAGRHLGRACKARDSGSGAGDELRRPDEYANFLGRDSICELCFFDGLANCVGFRGY
jgi:hypothetical protein